MELKQFSKIFKEKLKQTNIQLDDKEIEKFYQYMLLIQEWNEKINLTAIIEPTDIIIKHFIDSLSIVNYIKSGDKVIDVGTGAGFPGIPLKIYDETIKLTLLDSLNKRTIFLGEVANKLNINNDLKIVHGRAEEYAHDINHREKYNCAVSRAVAPLNILLEYLVPYVNVGGIIIAMKGSNSEEEILNSKNALNKLSTCIEKNEKIELPDACGERNIIILKKNKKTEKQYPRKAGIPKKNPL